MQIKTWKLTPLLPYKKPNLWSSKDNLQNHGRNAFIESSGTRVNFRNKLTRAVRSGAQAHSCPVPSRSSAVQRRVLWVKLVPLLLIRQTYFMAILRQESRMSHMLNGACVGQAQHHPATAPLTISIWPIFLRLCLISPASRLSKLKDLACGG